MELTILSVPLRFGRASHIFRRWAWMWHCHVHVGCKGSSPFHPSLYPFPLSMLSNRGT
jgi:hypothetical protein